MMFDADKADPEIIASIDVNGDGTVDIGDTPLTYTAAQAHVPNPIFRHFLISP